MSKISHLGKAFLWIKIFPLSTLLFLISTAYADSFYSSIGLGLPRYFVSSKAAGMGGAGVAVFDKLAINRANPAALKSYGFTRISIEFDLESVDSKHESGKVNSKYGNANGFQFLVPLRKNVSVGCGLGLVTDSRYSLALQGGDDDYIYHRRVDASGGLNRAAFNLAYNPIEQLYFGISAQFNFGKYQEEWKTDFVSSQYFDAADKISTHMTGGNYRFGAIIIPVKNLHLGISYANQATLNSGTTITHGSGEQEENLDQEVILPDEFSMGVSYTVKNKLLCAVDYTSQMWSEYQGGSNFNNSHRIGAGIEYTPSKEYLDSYISRISYRIGAYYTKLHIVDDSGKQMSELFATIGVGLPFHMNMGRLDFAVQIGQRASLPQFPFEEKIVRFVAALSGGEYWFVRRRR